jgi:hypothetical protein
LSQCNALGNSTIKIGDQQVPVTSYCDGSGFAYLSVFEILYLGTISRWHWIDKASQYLWGVSVACVNMQEASANAHLIANPSQVQYLA